MNNGRKLASVAERLVPGYLKRFDWGNVWERPLEHGAAFEWTILAALASQSRRMGWEYSFPVLDLPMGSVLFTLRNEVPRHHHSQPGHAAGATYRGQELGDRFLQAFIPKLLLQQDNVWYSVFREGCPYYKVMVQPNFDERPDILFLEGRPSMGYPTLTSDGHTMDFSFDMAGGGSVSGRLRVIVRSTMPCIKRTPKEGYAMPVAGIVEISVSKSVGVASAQLEAYQRLFGEGGTLPAQVLITGNKLDPLPWPSICVDLYQADIGAIEQDCRRAADLALATFGIT